MGVILKTLSVCVPIYNEIENLEDLFVEFNELNKSLNNTKIEIILIDNHSNDGTFDLFSKIVKRFNFKTIYVRHSQNYGYQVSLQTGLEYSTGDFVAVVDGDLQDPVNLIPLCETPDDLAKSAKNCFSVSSWSISPNLQ